MFRADHVNDALMLVLEREVSQRSDFTNIGIQRFDLLPRHRIGDAVLPMLRRRIVVCRSHYRRSPPGFAASQFQPFKGLRAGHFMHQMTVDVNQGRAVRLGLNYMRVPEFVIQRFCHFSCRTQYLLLSWRTFASENYRTGLGGSSLPATSESKNAK